MVVFGMKTEDPTTSGKMCIDSRELFSLVVNCVDARSLAIHPATTTHSKITAEAQISAGVEPEIVRLSIGIEAINDIIIDLDQALAKVEIHCCTCASVQICAGSFHSSKSICQHILRDNLIKIFFCFK